MDKESVEQLKFQLQQWLNAAQQFIGQIPPAQLYAAIGVLLFTSFFFLIIRLFKRRSFNTVLLTGLSGSGKTVLFHQLRDGSSHQCSVTSMEPNEGTFILHSEISFIAYSSELSTKGAMGSEDPKSIRLNVTGFKKFHTQIIVSNLRNFAGDGAASGLHKVMDLHSLTLASIMELQAVIEGAFCSADEL